jgi:hypothetical protein
MTTYRQAHWESLYATRDENEVSWFEETPAQSIQLLELMGAQPASTSSILTAAHLDLSIACWRRGSRT